MFDWFRKNWKIALILLVGVGIRLKLSSMTTHEDLITQLNWGKEANLKGNLKGFYEWDTWGGAYPNHPPLIIWIYYVVYPIHSGLMWFLSNLGNFIALHRLAPTKFLWLFDFAKWFGMYKYGTTSVLSGLILILKQFMIVADLLIGVVIAYVCKIVKTDWKKPVLIYLLLPFSWYLSSSWGQSDQLSFLFLIVAFILIYSEKYVWLSPLIYVIAADLKPNCVLLLPVFLMVWFKQKHGWKKLFFGGIVAVFFVLWTISWFTDKNIFIFMRTVLVKRLSTSESLINYNGFNFWYIFYPFSRPGVLDTERFLFVTAKVWGWIAFLITTFLGLRMVRPKKMATMFEAMFVAGFGSWLFMTGMHERYAFLGMIPLLFYSIYKPSYLKFFLALSTVFTINLLIAYWPADWIKNFLDSNDFLLPRILSVINLWLYIRVTRLMLKRNDLS